MSAEELLDDPQPRRWSWPARLIGGFCSQIAFGQLLVRMPDGEARIYRGRFAGPAATLEVRQPLRMATRLMTRGDVGLGESYVEGHWTTPDLAGLLEHLYLNLEHLGLGPRGLRWARWWDRLTHRRRDNSPRTSRRNIAHHYDLGNAFYTCWLDPSMTYSAALFDPTRRDGRHPGAEALDAAQQRKYERLLDALDAPPGAHILEIGCGWGGFAELAARRGYRVTGVTLSREQLAYARQRMIDAGVADRVELRLQDYRDIQGQFDHAVSIEMLEAVGETYWPQYYAALRRLVRPGGRVALQVIVIHEDEYPTYRRRPDFVQLYVFPGGMLPTPSHLLEQAARAGLRTLDTRWHAEDYAETLRRWRERFRAVAAQVEALGHDQRFQRLWDYYLAYCEAGFSGGCIDLAQTVLEVPAASRAA